MRAIEISRVGMGMQIIGERKWIDGQSKFRGTMCEVEKKFEIIQHFLCSKFHHHLR